MPLFYPFLRRDFTLFYLLLLIKILRNLFPGSFEKNLSVSALRFWLERTLLEFALQF